MLNFHQFEVVSFDCYGTLIDWERGILPVLRLLLSSREIDLSDDTNLELFAELKNSEYNYIKYRKLWQKIVQQLGKIFIFEHTETELKCLSESIKDWQPFPDRVAALAALKQKYKQAVISNMDDDLFADTAKYLKVELDWLITAEKVRSYKQSTRNERNRPSHNGNSTRKTAAGCWEYISRHRTDRINWNINSLGKSQTRENRIWGDTAGSFGQPDLEVPDLKRLVEAIG